jgi:hypothetical protein
VIDVSQGLSLMLCWACRNFLREFQGGVANDSQVTSDQDSENWKETERPNFDHHDSWSSFQSSVSDGCLICKKLFHAWKEIEVLVQEKFYTEASWFIDLSAK